MAGHTSLAQAELSPAQTRPFPVVLQPSEPFLLPWAVRSPEEPLVASSDREH